FVAREASDASEAERYTGRGCCHAKDCKSRSGRVFGNYVSDDRSLCSIAGNFGDATRRITLQITCPNWGVKMEGNVALNGKTISGEYSGPLISAGKFTMLKK